MLSNLQRGLLVILTATAVLEANGSATSSPSQAIQSGRALLNLVDPELDLLPEYRGANVYWLFHDNYLAAKMLALSNPQTAHRIMAAIQREGINKSGNVEPLF